MKKEALKNFKLYPEETHPKHYFSPDLGKPKPWYILWAKTAKNAVIGFVRDLINAIKEITRKVM